MPLSEEKLEKLLKISIAAITACSCAVLFPQVRSFIIELVETIPQKSLQRDEWMGKLLMLSITISLCGGGAMALLLSGQKFIEKVYDFCRRYFIVALCLIVAASVVVRIIMYVKCRSFWCDEAFLTASIAFRTWAELLTPPLSEYQSAPVFYVLIEKVMGKLLGYSEFSLRLFSLLSFFGLLGSITLLLKKAFGVDNVKIAFVVIMCALLPTYIWYSCELKPYMGDALFAVLLMLLYFLYTKNKIQLLALTALCVLFLGFSSPSIFFSCGILLSELLAAVFDKNKKKIFYVVISGAVVVAAFGLYYYWWMSPVVAAMDAFWNQGFNIWQSIINVIHIFNGAGNSKSIYVWVLVPFAAIGIYSAVAAKNRVAIMAALSLCFAFLASAIGKWPLSGRLWLFLPAIIFIFTPIGYDFIKTQTIYKNTLSKITKIPCLILIVYLSVNCFGYAGNKLYFSTEEVNPLIYYLQKNIKEDEMLYVYGPAICAFDFKNSYPATNLEGIAKDRLIYGGRREEWNEDSLGGDLRLILEHEKTYLLFQHHWTGISGGLGVLRRHGELTKIMDVYDTPLYYFERR